MNKNHKTYKIRPVRPKNFHLKVANAQKVSIWSHLKKNLRNHLFNLLWKVDMQWFCWLFWNWDQTENYFWDWVTFILKFRDGNTIINDMVIFSTKQNLLFSSQRHLNFTTVQVFLWFMTFDETVSSFFFKGVFSKPSGNLIVAPIFCFWS